MVGTTPKVGLVVWWVPGGTYCKGVLGWVTQYGQYPWWAAKYTPCCLGTRVPASWAVVCCVVGMCTVAVTIWAGLTTVAHCATTHNAQYRKGGML